MSKKDTIVTVIIGVIAIALGYGALSTVDRLFGVSAPQTVIVGTSTMNRIPECEGGLREYQFLVQKGQSVVIDSNHSTYAQNGVFVGSKRVITRRGGELACGYLFVEAHKGNKPLDAKYDSIFISPQGLGGHLLRSRSMELGTSTPSNRSRSLFALQSVPYLPSVPYNPDSQDFESTDWVKLINSSRKIEYLIGLSTLDLGGKIDEIRIAYKCWNPETGDETNDCQLGVGE